MMRHFVLVLVLIAVGIDAKEISAAGLTLRAQPIQKSCTVPVPPPIGNTGYDTKRPGPPPGPGGQSTFKQCVAGQSELSWPFSQPCWLVIDPGFECIQPAYCIAAAGAGTSKFRGDGPEGIKCRSAAQGAKITIADINFQGQATKKLQGSEVTGTYKVVGGEATAFTVNIGNSFMDCHAYALTVRKVTAQVTAGAGAAKAKKEEEAASWLNQMNAQADFFAEINMQLSKKYGVHFNGLEVMVEVKAEALTQMKASISGQGLKAHVAIGSAVTASAELKMKYFAAHAQAKVGLYAEAGIIFELDENWDLNTGADAGCFFGASANMKFGIGSAAYDVGTSITGGMQAAWDSITGKDYNGYLIDSPEDPAAPSLPFGWTSGTYKPL